MSTEEHRASINIFRGDLYFDCIIISAETTLHHHAVQNGKKKKNSVI